MLYGWTQKCAVSLANQLRSVAGAFPPLRTHQRYWTTEWLPSHKRILLIFSPLLLVKTENTYRNTRKMHKNAQRLLVLIFMARSRVPKNRLKADFYFHRYVHFSCILICILYIYLICYLIYIYIYIFFFSIHYFTSIQISYLQIYK